MKHLKPHYLIFFFFFTGTLVAASYYIGFSAGSSAPQESQSEINLSTARTYAQRYLDNDPAPYTGIVKGLVVDKSQFLAMGEIIKTNPDAQAFRVYYGIDNTNRYTRMVVGVGSTGNDLTNKIISTSPWMSGFCPPVCDNSGGSVID